MMGYFLAVVAVLLNVYGQLILKWQLNQAGSLPSDLGGKMGFLFGMFLLPWVLTAITAVIVAAILWMAALTKIELSYAYPVMGLSFVAIFVLSVLFLGEQFSTLKFVGALVIVLGVAISSQG